jgi:hypothetical protein
LHGDEQVEILVLITAVAANLGKKHVAKALFRQNNPS